MQISIWLNTNTLETIIARKAMDETVPQAAARFLREYVAKTTAVVDAEECQGITLDRLIRAGK